MHKVLFNNVACLSVKDFTDPFEETCIDYPCPPPGGRVGVREDR